jgi:DDE family transposase
MRSVLCDAWQKQVQAFFTSLHGHQSKTLAWFVLGAIRAKSVVLPQIAEALLAESEAKASSIQRRLERFLSNPRIDVKEVWEELLMQVMPFFQTGPIRVIIDVTPYEEHAQVIYVGLLQHSRVLPLVWKVMPGQQKWDKGFWDCISELFEQVAPPIGSVDCTIIGDSAFGCFPMVQLCQQYHWHYLFRIAGQHTCQRRSSQGEFGASTAVGKLVREPGKRFHGSVRLWQDESIETELSIFWRLEEEEALIIISDVRAGKGRVAEYRRRWRVEATFQDGKSRGWDWEASHVRALDRVNRLLLVLFLLLWWLAHLAATCIHHGKRDRYDRADRRDKGIFRLGRLYLFDIERRNPYGGNIQQCLLFRKNRDGWCFSLRF